MASSNSSSSSSSFNPLSLIAAPITGAFDYAGSKKQAEAQKEAAELQAKSTQEALDFTKALKGKQETAAAPYLALGGLATGRLPGLAAQGPAGGPPMAYNTQRQFYQAPQPAAQPMAQMGASGAGGTPTAGMGGMVTVQAPTGETRQLPQALAQQAVARGAKIVG